MRTIEKINLIVSAMIVGIVPVSIIETYGNSGEAYTISFSDVAWTLFGLWAYSVSLITVYKWWTGGKDE